MGNTQQYLIGKDFSDGTASVLDYIFTYGCWILYFGLVFICVVSLFSVIRKGLKRYCLENTWIIRIVITLVKSIKKKLKFFLTLDAKTPINRWIVRAAIINFIILAVICCFWFIGIFLLLIYSLVFVWYLTKIITREKMNYDKIQNAVHNMSEGNLEQKMEEEVEILIYSLMEIYSRRLFTFANR